MAPANSRLVSRRTRLAVALSFFSGLSATGQGLSLIAVETADEAQRIRAEIASRVRSFGDAAAIWSIDPSAADGGYLGPVAVGDLRAEFRDALDGVAPGAPSLVTPSGGVFYILRLTLGADDWNAAQEAGRRASRSGRLGPSRRHLETALALAERFDGDDPRLASSLNDLGAVLQLAGRGGDAETLLRRAVSIRERVLGEDDPDLGESLNNLAALLENQGRNDEAEVLYGRALDAFERTGHANAAPVAGNLARLREVAGDFDEAASLYGRMIESRWAEPVLDPGVLDLLEHVTDIAVRRFIRDETFEHALSRFRDALTRPGLSEGLYIAIAEILLGSDLADPAEVTLREGLRRFPDSVLGRFRLAELLVSTGKVGQALSEFERLAERGSALTPLEQSVVHRRIGDILTDASRSHAALAAYREAVRRDPGGVDARLALGNVHALANRLEDAVEQYRTVLDADPNDPTARYGLAEAHLRRGRFDDARAAAEGVLAIDPDFRRARFVRATALMRLGRTADGRAEFERYRALENRVQQAEDDRVRFDGLMVQWGRLWSSGFHDAAEVRLGEAAAIFPAATVLALQQALVDNARGRHSEAVRALSDWLPNAGGEGFLAHRLLSAEYAVLGDIRMSDRHRARYLHAIDAALQAHLN